MLLRIYGSEHIPYSRVGVCVNFEIEHGLNMKPVQSTENK